MFATKQGFGLRYVSEEKEEQQRAVTPWWKQQHRSVIGFASVGAAAAAAPSSPSLSSFSFEPPLPRGKKESRTGTEFPSELCHVQRKACPVLTGVG